ncbi:MAG: hypothetical protein WCK47_11570 [bacterium]|nr:hypothetical protein [Candidatus Sumerlaeota bacterium]
MRSLKKLFVPSLLGLFVMTAMPAIVTARCVPAKRQYAGRAYYPTGFQYYCPVAAKPSCILLACDDPQDNQSQRPHKRTARNHEQAAPPGEK